MRTLPLAALTLFAALLQAESPVLQNTGKPMRLAATCTEDDIRAAGLTCPSENPCPIYLELAGLEVVGNRLFVTGNLHADTATLWSVLLASQDGGKTWTEPYDRVRGAGLDLIQFLDFENGWVAGQMLGAVTRDPFFLITHDGGKIWYNRPVFSEGRTAALDYFRFDSKTHGWMWLDRSQAGEEETRYESYESMTGGDSWSIRETGSKPLRKGPRAPGPGDWRLRADPALKAYRLEHHAPAGWETAAAFAIRPGECREPEPTFAEEPPAPAAEEQTESEAPAPAAPSRTKPPSLNKPRP